MSLASDDGPLTITMHTAAKTLQPFRSDRGEPPRLARAPAGAYARRRRGRRRRGRHELGHSGETPAMQRTAWLACGLVLALPMAAARAAEPGRVGLRVPEGFAVDRAAGAPEVAFPMFAAFDDRGRLFVAESSGGD